MGRSGLWREFLKAFSKFSSLISRKKFPDLGPVLPSERINRFILQTNHFGPSGPKYAAFLPPISGKTSIFRVRGLAEPDIWALGERFVVSPTRSALKAKASLLAEDAMALNLRVEAETSRHFRHANIVG